MMETLLLGAKWVVYTLLCGGDYRRYMGLRAAAVRRLASRGWYEREHVRFLRSYLRAGDTAIDVGANLGAYSIAMAAAVGASGKVLAFEPLPEAYEGFAGTRRPHGRSRVSMSRFRIVRRRLST